MECHTTLHFSVSTMGGFKAPNLVGRARLGVLSAAA
jgi:hypothetical protein